MRRTASSSESLLSSVAARRGHFKFESGHHGDFWMDLETLCARPRALKPFATDLASRLEGHGIDAVCGPLNEGALIALMVASELDCQFTYAERFAQPGVESLFPVEYRLPTPQHSLVRGRRVAIVNDVISAGSAVRGAYASLQELGAVVVAVAALAVLGTPFETFARERRIPLEALAHVPHNIWIPAECPLCADGMAVEPVGV